MKEKLGFLFFFRRRIIGDNKWMAILPLHQWMEMEGWFWFTLYRDPMTQCVVRDCHLFVVSTFCICCGVRVGPLDLLPSQCLFPSGRHEPVGSDVWSGVDHGRRHMPLTSAHPKIQTDQATDISSNAFELYLQCMPSTCSTFR